MTITIYTVNIHLDTRMLTLFTLYTVFGLVLASFAHYLLREDILTEERILRSFTLILLISIIFSLPFLVYTLLNVLWTWFARTVDDITLDDYGC